MALTLVFWTAVLMGTVVGLATVIGPLVMTPVFEATDGVSVPARPIRLLRYGTIGGGTVATVGFALLATAEALRIGELGLLGIAGIVFGGPVFSVAFGGSIALVLKVRVARRTGDGPRRSRAEK